MRRSPAFATTALVLVLLGACASPPAGPEPLLQPEDLEGVEVVEAESLPLGRFVPCDAPTDPQPELGRNGLDARYRVEADDAEEDADGSVTTGVYAPDAQALGDVLAFVDVSPDACPESDQDVVLDEAAAADAAEAAGLDADAVRVLRYGPGWTPNWRAYAVVDGRLAVVQAGGTAVVDALDLPAVVAAAAGRLRDYDSDLPPSG